MARKFSGGARFGREIAPARPLPETSRASQTRQHDGQRALVCAVVAGLLRWPDEIARHAEALAPLIGADPRIAAILDHCDGCGALESGAFTTIFDERGLSHPQPDEYNRIRYPFTIEDGNGELASEALAAAIAKLVEEPLVDAALEAATARFDIDEQQRLRRRKRDINLALMGTAVVDRG